MMTWFELLRTPLESLFGTESGFTSVLITGLFLVFWTALGLLLAYLAKPVIFRLLKLNIKLTKKIKLPPESSFAVIDQAKRGQTVARALINLVRIFVWFAVIMIMLDGIGINVTPILASAGVVGVAIAFGTQALVKDFVSGIFFIAEKTFLVGELVQIGTFTGIVKEIGLRTTKIEDWKGAFLIINNGNILSVVNYSRDYSLAVVDITLGNPADFQQAGTALQNFAQSYGKKYPEMVEPLMYLGMTDSTDLNATFRFTAKCRPAEHFGVERALRQDLLEYCEANRLVVSYNRMLLSKESADGK